MDISIITVNTNDHKTILDQIASVQAACQGVEYEQIISDNGSTDGSLEIIKHQYPDVRIVENDKNIGFGAANNATLPYISGEFILCLNPDMRLEPNSLKKLTDWMREHPRVGIASCKLVDEQGNIDPRAKPRRFPTLADQLLILFKLPHIFPSLLNRYLYHDFNTEIEQSVDSVRGSFLMIRKEVVHTLGRIFDNRYFIWFEDVDLCREVWRLGYQVVYTPLISCVDYVGQTFKRQQLFQKQVWFTSSMLAYFKKWHPWYVWIWIALARPIALCVVSLKK